MKGHKPQQISLLTKTKIHTSSKSTFVLELGELCEGGEEEVEKRKDKSNTNNY